MKPLYIIVWIFFGIYGCTLNQETDLSGFRYNLSIEGWIENGNVPHVLISQSLPMEIALDSVSIDAMIVRWAKVSVSDGNNTEILTGRIDTNYFPPFIYKGSFLRGEAGKKYTLKVEYSGKVWEAETSIPEPVPMEKVSLLKQDDNVSLQLTFTDPDSSKQYYKLFTKIKHRNKRFLPSVLGNFNDNLFSGKQQTIPVNKGIEQHKMKDLNMSYDPGDTVYIKFCTMPEEGFVFWSGYENEIINGQNPFFPANSNLISNIKDGLGIWCGYGVVSDSVEIQ